MSEVINEPCVLCEEAATRVDTDHGLFRWYKCSSLDCGEFEISTSVLDQVRRDLTLREHFSKTASRNRNSDSAVSIFKSNSGVESKVVKRSELRS